MRTGEEMGKQLLHALDIPDSKGKKTIHLLLNDPFL
jgi:hypothetical protein